MLKILSILALLATCFSQVVEPPFNVGGGAVSPPVSITSGFGTLNAWSSSSESAVNFVASDKISVICAAGQ